MGRRVELLAPAGDMECLHYALQYGADAVYLGAKQYGMRASAENFSIKQIAAAVKMAHSLGRKVYLTMNTLPRNDEMPSMPGAIRDAWRAGVDAFIVADIGVLRFVKEYAPGAEIHFSTQAGITNYVSATAAWEMGAKRVVLARELTLEEISTIRQNTPRQLELEVFVHGAMCMSVSGRCLISNYMSNRDANRGQCAQPCRWRYSLMEEKRPGQYMPIGEGGDGSYILSADDLCAAPFIDKVIEAGAASLKIEGRAKSFYYVASTTAAYRKAVDAVEQAAPGGYKLPDFSEQELTRTSHRPYSNGFFLGHEGATQSPMRGDYIRNWQLVGTVEMEKDGWLYCEQRGKFTLGQEMEALLPEGRVVTFKPDALYDGNAKPIKSTPHSKMAFILPLPSGQYFPKGTILRCVAANATVKP